MGLSEPSFKKRWSNHKTDFKHEKHEYSTELSKYIWSLKRKQIDFEIKWKILERAQPFSPVSEICNLCTTEKYYIVFEPQEATINQLDEINGPCLHKHAKLLQKT